MGLFTTVTVPQRGVYFVMLGEYARVYNRAVSQMPIEVNIVQQGIGRIS